MPTRGGKGADDTTRQQQRRSPGEEEAHSGPLLWYCSWPRPTTHPPSLSKQFVSLIAPTHTAQQTVSPICSSICRIKASKVQVYVGCFGQTQNRTLLSFIGKVQASDFLYSSLATAAVKCCSSFLSALESGLASVGALPSCLISWQIKGADPGLYK